jgi:UDP-N-acetylmuramoylalanine--D-glutamate ligase
VQAVVLMGRDAPVLRQALAATGVPLMDAATLPQAVELAASQAQSGHAVLLSPACASFDMFDSYIHRAAVFTQAVQQLAIDKGQA